MTLKIRAPRCPRRRLAGRGAGMRPPLIFNAPPRAQFITIIREAL
jgi:hypothetical protein